MSGQDSIIKPGDSVRIHYGHHAGQTGTATDVSWQSNRFGAYARVRVRFGGGETADYSMGNMEKVNESPNDTPLAKKVGGRK